ncbi:MAG: Gfo/Idh/MocA family oxidoreductase [Rhodospirillaceae bacterium]|nr:Gfo/Idh/MocA family oxidoreductase [Rhodospirillaceae bacterium]MBT3926051.1 Gfo/Idh/MocA family oxidoreductase [Rhodospirillaceae bacterium]MBT5675148.1 Gfo/Idh/MocA family oxidoreductase [Rhodospirillaceae bacterium]MBT5778990.1 Gfo/Idh/MocA family oxidoreductase [Rhodospirillaceae bacterium]
MPQLERLKTVIVGLGRAGSRFDEEPDRGVVWSHAGAYLARDDAFEIVGACDSDADARAAFARRCPDVAVFDSLDDLIQGTRPDIASICTPEESHALVLHHILNMASLQTVWCEKPMAASLAEGQGMVDACAARDVRLVVSHGRRWLPLWQRFSQMLAQGAVGPLVSLRIAMPNRLWSVTSHAVDLALMLAGPVSAVQSFDLAELEQDEEPAKAAFLRFRSGAYGIIQITGKKNALLVEAEAIGAAGRLVANESASTIRQERFVKSENFAGYQELAVEGETQHGSLSDSSHFSAICDEIAALTRQTDTKITCSGADALATQRVLEEMAHGGIAAAGARQSA